jgi:hypothetical protein
MAFGYLASLSGQRLPLIPLQSASGWYLGTRDQDGPFSRESVEYFPTSGAAENAMRNNQWTQRDHA